MKTMKKLLCKIFGHNYIETTDVMFCPIHSKGVTIHSVNQCTCKIIEISPCVRCNSLAPL